MFEASITAFCFSIFLSPTFVGGKPTNCLAFHLPWPAASLTSATSSMLVPIVWITLDSQKGRFYDHAHETDIPNRPRSCSGLARCRVDRDQAACLCAGADVDH